MRKYFFRIRIRGYKIINYRSGRPINDGLQITIYRQEITIVNFVLLFSLISLKLWKNCRDPDPEPEPDPYFRVMDLYPGDQTIRLHYFGNTLAKAITLFRKSSSDASFAMHHWSYIDFDLLIIYSILWRYVCTAPIDCFLIKSLILFSNRVPNLYIL